MHIPKTIINKLIPFFSQKSRNKLLQQAKVSIDHENSIGSIEVANQINWARVFRKNLFDEEDDLQQNQFLIKQENLEAIGYGDSLEEAALGFDEEEFEMYLSAEKHQSSARFQQLVALAAKFPYFKKPYLSDDNSTININLYELKKIVDLAVSVAEASQINAPAINLQFKTDTSPLYWELINPFNRNSSTYTADGVLMPVKTIPPVKPCSERQARNLDLPKELVDYNEIAIPVIELFQSIYEVERDRQKGCRDIACWKITEQKENQSAYLFLASGFEWSIGGKTSNDQVPDCFLFDVFDFCDVNGVYLEELFNSLTQY